MNGPRLFNISKVSLDEFNEQLDKFLASVPDEPNGDGLTPAACDLYTASPSNSIKDQARQLKHRRPVFTIVDLIVSYLHL